VKRWLCAWRERRLIRKFNRLYYHGRHGSRRPFRQVHWLGVPTLKCPLDLWIFQEIICRTQPEVIIETGVKYGGSSLYLASMCDLLGTGEVLACDVSHESVHEQVRRHPRITLLEGNSVSPEVYETICTRCEGLRTMVVLDSDHRAAHVAEELRLYGPLVSIGCYLICEDTCINGHPVSRSFGPGPYEAVQEFLRGNPHFRIDRECEKLMVTFNPSGYLVRTGLTPVGRRSSSHRPDRRAGVAIPRRERPGTSLHARFAAEEPA
jgi:cephalosporin hydroxylase